MSEIQPPVVAPEAAPVVDPAAAGLPPAGEPTVYDEAYVKRLRDESAEWRTKATPYEEAFDGYDENEVATLLDLAQLLKTDPASAADWLENASRAIKEEQAKLVPPAPAAPVAPPADDDRPMTRAELASFLEERESTKAAERQRLADAEAIDKEVRDLGYDPGTVWGLRVMQVAVENGGDLNAAHEVVQGEKQKIIDDYVAELAAQGGAAGVTPAAGGIPSGERTIKSLDDAARAMRERLDRVT